MTTEITPDPKAMHDLWLARAVEKFQEAWHYADEQGRAGFRTQDALVVALTSLGINLARWSYDREAPRHLRCIATEGGGYRCRHFADEDHEHETSMPGWDGNETSFIAARLVPQVIKL